MTPKVVNKGARPTDPRNFFCRNLDIPSDQQGPQPPAIDRPPRAYDPRGMIARATDVPTDEWVLPTKAEVIEIVVENIIQRPKRALHKVKSMCSSVKGHVFSHSGPATKLPTEDEMHDTQSMHSFHSSPATNLSTMHGNHSRYSFKTMLRGVDAVLIAEDATHRDAAQGAAAQGAAVITDGADGLNPGTAHGPTTHGATTLGAAIDTVHGIAHGTTVTTDGTRDSDPGATPPPTDSVDSVQRVRSSWIALNAKPGERVRSIYVDDNGIAAEVNVVQQQGHKSIHVPGYDHGLGHHPNQTGRLPNPTASIENISTAYKVNWQMTGLTELIHNSIVDVTKSMASDPEGVQRVQTAGGVFVPLATVKEGLLEFQEYYAEFLQHGGLNGNKVMGGEAYLLAMVGKRSEIDNGTLKLVEFNECEK